MRKLCIGMSIVFMLCLLCGCAKEQEEDPMTQIANPMVEYESEAEATAKLDFLVLLPHYGTAQKVFLIDGSLFSAEYAQEDVCYTYRMARSAEDISGDYNTYQTTDIVTVNSREVTVKGNDGLIHLALWQDESGGRYAISMAEPVELTVVQAIIETVY